MEGLQTPFRVVRRSSNSRPRSVLTAPANLLFGAWEWLRMNYLQKR
jgi:hypothetical protein